MSSVPKLAVVIPTRDRASTLKYALQTCVSQSYENLEIVVSDNASTDDTRDVVESFADPRVRYVKSAKRLAMHDNWEFGFSHVSADYATILGDDDGLVPGAMQGIADILARVPAQAVTWQYGQYFWPTYFDESERNVLTVPLRNKLVRIDSRVALRHMFRFYLGYTRGPCAYYSMLSMDSIRKVIARDGRLFAGVIPDVYSALAIASVTDEYLYSTRPFSIAGLSKHSTGTSQLTTRPGQHKEAANAFIAEIGYARPEFSLLLGSITAMVVDSLVRFHETAKCLTPSIPFRRAFRTIIAELSALPGALEGHHELLILLAERHGEGAYVRRLLESDAAGGDAFTAARKALGRVVGSRLSPLGGNHLRVDASRFGAFDVASACDVAGNLLGDYVVPGSIAKYSLPLVVGSRLINRLPETGLFLGM